MTNIFRYIDDALFDYVFQPVCNSVAGWTKPQSIALSCLMGSMMFDIVTLFTKYKNGNPWSDLGIQSIGIFGGCWLYYSGSTFVLNGRTRNPKRLMFGAFLVRQIVLWATVLSQFPFTFTVQELLGRAFQWLFLAYLFFEACDNPPPPVLRREHGWRLAPSGT